MAAKKLKKLNVGPIMLIIVFSAILLLLSFILNKIGFKGYLIDPETNEKTIVTVNNIFSTTGLKYLFSSTVLKFSLIEPLAILIMSFISLSILDASGLLNHLLKPFKNIKSNYITFIILFVSIISSFFGEYSYAIILPLFGLVYKYLDRNPKSGIMISFIGITIGYGTGVFYNFQDILLSNYSTLAAKQVIASYTNEPSSLLYIMIVSTIILTIVGTNIIDKKLNKKVRKNEEEMENFIESSNSLKITGIVFLILLAIVVYSIIPSLPFSGLLLDNNEELYIAKLLGNNAPFKDGILLILLMITMICGYIYGRISRNIKNTRDYNKSISKSFENTGFLFAILFFASIMLNIIEWTNINNVIILNLISFMESLTFNGLFLIIPVFIICILITIFLPLTLDNWIKVSPVMVPLLLRANISPAFSQIIFKAADSIGKCFSPIYIYFIVMIGLLYKYDDNGEEIKIFAVMKKTMPFVIVLSVVWLVIIVGWYLLGFKVGISTYPTV